MPFSRDRTEIKKNINRNSPLQNQRLTYEQPLHYSVLQIPDYEDGALARLNNPRRLTGSTPTDKEKDLKFIKNLRVWMAMM